MAKGIEFSQLGGRGLVRGVFRGTIVGIQLGGSQWQCNAAKILVLLR